MVLGFLEKALGGKAGGAGRAAAVVGRAAPRAVPRVEGLEDRCVPTATRQLPGLLANTFAPGGAGTTQVFPGGRTDDGSSTSTPLGFNINFFGISADNVFVNNNGNITLNTAISQFTPTALNSDNGGIPIIAAFYADVDTRPATSGVTTYGQDTLCGHLVFGVNYFSVGYFSQHVDKLNTFQLILIERGDTGPGNFDIEFNYDKIQWETGDASGGTNGLGGQSVRVGYSNGTGNPGTFFELPGSGSNGAFLDGGPQALVNQRLLASTPGRLHFIVRGGQVQRDFTGNLDITDATRQFRPFRYLFDAPTQTYRGNLTLLNVGGRLSAGDPCEDLFATDLIATGSFGGPITAVFNNLPPGVQVANATGVTTGGLAFITVSLDRFSRARPLRIPIVLTNPLHQALGTFFQGFSVRVFAGNFDATAL